MVRNLATVTCLLVVASCARSPKPGPGVDPAPAGRSEKESEALTVEWEKDTLRIRGPGLPGEVLEIWYLEAFCRSGSTDREWSKTTIPHRTELVESSADKRRLKLASHVEGGVEVVHEIEAGTDSVDFRVTATSHGSSRADVSWVQPCMRVDRFTGREQADYIGKCFIFIEDTLTALDKTEREEEALYKGGQVYVPRGIDLNDVNPRPISPDVPSNGLIGCFSADGSKILAMAWEPCQELFQGVRVCIHSDFRIGGLEPGETKKAHGKVYVLDNDPEKLLARYRADFAEE